MIYKVTKWEQWVYLPSKEPAIIEGTSISCYSNRHSLAWTLPNKKREEKVKHNVDSKPSSQEWNEGDKGK